MDITFYFTAHRTTKHLSRARKRLRSHAVERQQQCAHALKLLQHKIPSQQKLKTDKT